MNETQYVLATLQDPVTIRKKANALLIMARQGKLTHFAVDDERMLPTADYVVRLMKQNYPDLKIPYHSRWRHFETDGVNRIKPLIASIPQEQRGCVLYELVIISILLDAGAGLHWRFKDKETGKEYSRSEGLALASLELYKKGRFSARANNPFRVDATRLLSFNEKDIFEGLQVSADNPLEAVAGRVRLLNQLGNTLLNNPNYFGQNARLGNFYSFIMSQTQHNSLSVRTIFQAVLNAFQSIWPPRALFQGISLGDVWLHQALKTQELGSEYIPFHKLSQWLTYSLIEPLEEEGINVADIDVLTALAEYRNGGLLIDMGLLVINNKEEMLIPHAPYEELIVEWRGLTIALLDELAEHIRNQLHQTKDLLPLAKILQGGTWNAGRLIAQEKRVSGGPPLNIISDGTVF